MVHGLALAGGQADLVGIINTGDDGPFYGLLVCPDLDINLYALAGVVAERGWGYADDTFHCLEGLATYGRATQLLGDSTQLLQEAQSNLQRTQASSAGAGAGAVGSGRAAGCRACVS